MSTLGVKLKERLENRRIKTKIHLVDLGLIIERNKLGTRATFQDWRMEGRKKGGGVSSVHFQKNRGRPMTQEGWIQ